MKTLLTVKINDIVHLTEAGLVDRWGGVVTAITLKRWRRRGLGPAFIRIGRKLLYPLDFVREYEQDNTIIPKK